MLRYQGTAHRACTSSAAEAECGYSAGLRDRQFRLQNDLQGPNVSVSVSSDFMALYKCCYIIIIIIIMCWMGR